MKTQTIAHWKGHGRVFVERIEGAIAVIRFDSDEGTRSPEHRAPLAQITWDYVNGWKPMPR